DVYKRQVKVYVMDYRRPGQRGLEDPFRFGFLNRLRNRYARATAARIATMTQQELDELDRHPPCGSIPFTVALCASWVTAEAIKLLTGLGKVSYYPKETVVNLLDGTLRIRNKYSASYIIRQFLRRE
ncbi:MAG: hypothetical protein N2255_10710, partial [Kiritimatiellae bacterium]|nr:hypothetical protein [Kiritimatiellia bacterium]